MTTFCFAFYEPYAAKKGDPVFGLGPRDGSRLSLWVCGDEDPERFIPDSESYFELFPAWDSDPTLTESQVKKRIFFVW